MIFPEDYKFVGIKDKERRGEPIYFSTEYLLSREGPRLYQVKSSGEGFMRNVDELELIASGPEIEFYPAMEDTRNRARLIDLANRVCRRTRANTVVFQGPDEHITFVKDPDLSQILEIEILDVSPPHPPWLVHVLGKLESCGIFGDLTLRFRPRILDLHKFECDSVYYPCRAAGLGRSLDCDPIVHDRPLIVGCEVSREIFLAGNAGKDFEFVNICPLQSKEPILEPSGPFITRCCKSERRGLTQQEWPARHSCSLGRWALEDCGVGEVSGRRAKKVAVLPGDGIGPEVVGSALAVLEAVNAEFEKVPLEIGYGRWKRTGLALAEEDLETIKECDCVLLGAVTTPPDPNYRSVLLRLRRELDLYANIRPFPPQSWISLLCGRIPRAFIRARKKLARKNPVL